MRSYLFLLSGDHPELGLEEIKSLFNKKTIRLNERLGLIRSENIKKKELSRLGYVKKAYELLFCCDLKAIREAFRRYEWNRIYNKSFSLRIVRLDNAKLGVSERELASCIWKKLKTPRVCLSNAETKIELIVGSSIGARAYCGRLLWQNVERFSERRSHLRPCSHPTSLHPKLARALVNLAGVKEGMIIDPFCGTGGTLIEAGLVGLTAVGLDIDFEMLKKAKKNLNFYGINSFALCCYDSTKISRELSYVVTDLPYGKNTRVKDISRLYKAFVSVLENNLKNIAVVVFPDFFNAKKLFKRLGVKKEILYYIHRSLSKRILVIVPKKSKEEQKNKKT